MKFELSNSRIWNLAHQGSSVQSLVLFLGRLENAENIRILINFVTLPSNESLILVYFGGFVRNVSKEISKGGICVTAPAEAKGKSIDIVKISIDSDSNYHLSGEII